MISSVCPLCPAPSAMEEMFAHVPKKRRTVLQHRPRPWSIVTLTKDEESVTENEHNALEALGILAQAATLAEQTDNAEESGQHEDTVWERRVRGAGAKRRGRVALAGEAAGGDVDFGTAGGDGSLVPVQLKRDGGAALGMSHYNGLAQGDATNRSSFPGTVFPALNGHFVGRNEPAAAPGLRESSPSQPGQDISRPRFKRCASHVYIAQFIEQQTNAAKRLQQQQRQANGIGSHFGSRHSGEAELSEQPANGNSNGLYHMPNAPTMPESTANILPGHGQGLPSASAAHQYLGPAAHFMGPGSGQGHSPALQALPSNFAQLLGQHQGAFPFLPPGLHMGGAFTSQQQAAAAQALAGFQGVFPANLMAGYPGAIAPPQLGGTTTSTVNGNTAISPSLPLLSVKAQPHADPSSKLLQHTNGSTIKHEEANPALLKHGLSTTAIAGVDFERLRAMLPPGFLEHPARFMQLPLGDNLKAQVQVGRSEQSQLDPSTWAAGMPTRM